jgi:hypothetical protein
MVSHILCFFDMVRRGHLSSYLALGGTERNGVKPINNLCLELAFLI